VNLRDLHAIHALDRQGSNVVVPAWVIVERRRQRAERMKRVASTIVGQAQAEEAAAP
jgi:hypothetical protein